MIELLIVVVVLGILAGIVVFAVGSAREDSADAACRADMKTVSLAAEAYKATHNSYPTQTELTAGSGAPLRAYPVSTSYVVTYDQASGTATGALTAGGAC